MYDKVLVINPNSNPGNTQWIDAALEPLRASDGPTIECRTLEDGPLAIENDLQSAQVVPPLCDLIERESGGTGAFVVACFSDPGVLAARELTDKPVFGICEAGLTMALNFGDRIGMLHNESSDVAPALRIARGLGLNNRVVGGRPIDLPMARMDEKDTVLESMTNATKGLMHDMHVDVVVFGCAAMSPYRRNLQDICGIPVIDPTQAAVGIAVAAIRCLGDPS